MSGVGTSVEFGWREALAAIIKAAGKNGGLVRPDLAYRKDDLAAPLVAAMGVWFWISLITAFLGVVTREYSWVDRLWSIMPFVYAWMFALHPVIVLHEPVNPRLVLMAALTTLWGVRLTYNFWRKGGYSRGSEDYRWAEVRTWFSPSMMQLFNVFFIAAFQNLLLLWIITPSYLAWLGRDRPLGVWDYVVAVVFLAFWVLESVSDLQQWEFQQKKRSANSQDPQLRGEYADGFIRSGLFRYSRHPNFFSEQAMWWTFYLFGVIATSEPFNWTLLGPLMLSLLFHGSTNLTERLSLQKYGARYADYQSTTSRLMPWFPRQHKTMHTD